MLKFWLKISFLIFSGCCSEAILGIYLSSHIDQGFIKTWFSSHYSWLWNLRVDNIKPSLRVIFGVNWLGEGIIGIHLMQWLLVGISSSQRCKLWLCFSKWSTQMVQTYLWLPYVCEIVTVVYALLLVDEAVGKHDIIKGATFVNLASSFFFLVFSYGDTRKTMKPINLTFLCSRLQYLYMTT